MGAVSSRNLALALVVLIGCVTWWPQSASAGSCLLPPSCPAGEFLLMDLQSSVLLRECFCTPCIPGTFKAVSGNSEVCEAAGDFEYYAPAANLPRQTRTPGMCTSFKYDTLAGLLGLYQDQIADNAAVTFQGASIPVESYYSSLLPSYLWGNMRQLRNHQDTCGDLRVLPQNSKNVEVAMIATRPGSGLHRFDLQNVGNLPINFTFSAPSFAQILTQNQQPTTSTQVLQGATTATYQIIFNTGTVPTAYEWANKSGFSFEVQIANHQYWDQASPRVPEPTAIIVFHVAYTPSAFLIAPTSLEFFLASGKSRSARVQLMNLSPGEASYSVSIEYDSGSGFLSAIPSGTLNGSSKCEENGPVSVDLSEFTTSVEVAVDGSLLLAGRYSARIIITGGGSSATLLVSLEVSPGEVDPSGYFLVLTNDSFIAASYGEALVLPRDSFGQVSFNFPDDPSAIVFDIFLEPQFQCDNCNSSTQTIYLSGIGYRFGLNFPRAGTYKVTVLDENSNPVQGSGAIVTVLPIDCSRNGEQNSEYHGSTNDCRCLPGYGEILRDDHYVVCQECPQGSHSLDGICQECPPGTYSSLPKSTSCSTCRSREPATAIVLLYPFMDLEPGDAIDLENEAHDSIPSGNRDNCDLCPTNSIARSDINICLACPLDKKTRKVVDEIVSKNETVAIVTWKYDCVCRAQYYREADGSCSPCPVGGYCMGKTKDEILPLEGYWKNPWAAGGLQLEGCRVASSCPGVYLDPEVLQQTDAFFYESEIAYLLSLNQTITSIHAEHGECSVNFVCSEGYAGPLCNKCDTSYTRVGTSGCTKCLPQGAMVAVIIIGILCALLLTAFIVTRTIAMAKAEMEYLGSFKTINGLSLAHSERPEASFRDSRVRDSSKGEAESGRAPVVQSRTHSPEIVMSKIVISHLQEVAVSVAFLINWPTWVSRMFDVFNVVSSAGQTLFSLSCLLNPSSENGAVIGGACLSNHSVTEQGVFDATRPLTFFIEAIFISVIPFAWAFLAGLFWYIFYWRQKRLYQKRRGRSAWNFFLLTLVVLIFLLYPTLSRTALRFFSCSASFAGYRFLEADFNVVCFGPTHNAWMASMGLFMLIFFAIGIPGGIFWVLYHHHHHISKYKPVFGFVYLGFKPEFYYWECVIMTRKLLYAVCAVIIGPLGSDIQAYCGLALLLFYLQLQSHLNPYETINLNRAEFFGLIVRFATLLLGLALDSENSSSEAVQVFGTLIVVLNAIFLIFALSIFAKAIRRLMEETMEVYREHGFMVAIGLKKRPYSSDVEDGSGDGAWKEGNKKSAIPQAHDLYPASSLQEDENHQVVFRSERESSGQEPLDSGNPIFGVEMNTSKISPEQKNTS